MIELIDRGRSKLYVAAQALDHGETDLELQCSTMLKDAYEEIDEAYDKLQGLRLEIADRDAEVPHG
jgi:hypothetical protein